MLALATLLVLEIWLRVFDIEVVRVPLFPGDREPAEGAHTDPYIGWHMVPHEALKSKTDEFDVVYRTNAQGFRGRDLEFEADNRRMVFVGDSFTFGIGVAVDAAFPSLVEKGVDNARAYNLGIPAFGLDQMMLALEHYGLPLKPHLVVLSFIVDDFERSLTAYRKKGDMWLQKPLFTLDDDRLVLMTTENRPGVFWSFMEQKTRVFRAWRRIERRLNRDLAIGHRWKINRAIFKATRDACNAAGASLLVVYIRERDLTGTYGFFKDAFKELNIAFLDLSQRPAKDEAPLYYRSDPHFNPAGHRFAAQAIIETIAGIKW